MIKENVSLKPYNTFNFEVTAKQFAEVNTPEELIKLLSLPEVKDQKKLFLGGGSNILLLNDFDGLVIKINLYGKNIIDIDDDFALVEVMAGENWHDFVLFCLENNLNGIENLSLIPGTAGAAPMQNIGAYGVEVKDTFDHLEALNLETLEIEKFNNQQCQFGYRESFFKKEGKDKYVILKVCFKLSKKQQLNVSYGAIQKTLEEMGVKKPTSKDVSNAVITIRQSKLPDPAVIPNSGSFFKNPVITRKQFEDLKTSYPDIPGYLLDNDTIKVPAAWLIDQAGWKGKRFGNVGIHDKQALVLVHFGGGEGKEIANLAKSIQNSVLEKYSIEIFPEVNFIS